MLELTFKDHQKGVSYDCASCKPTIKKLRRCQEPRTDFTLRDGAHWPIYLIKGATPFSFCPGKATWDQSAVSLFNTMLICAESHSLYNAGGVADQPSWFMELYTWFLPRYNEFKFASRVKSVVGDNKPGGKK